LSPKRSAAKEDQMGDKDYQQGQSDASRNQGQRDPNSFKSDQERKDYQAGWNKAQQDKPKK
jgi:hypothetical protein